MIQFSRFTTLGTRAKALFISDYVCIIYFSCRFSYFVEASKIGKLSEMEKKYISYKTKSGFYGVDEVV